jgi:hypothetical protein
MAEKQDPTTTPDAPSTTPAAVVAAEHPLSLWLGLGDQRVTRLDDVADLTALSDREITFARALVGLASRRLDVAIHEKYKAAKGATT